MARKKIKTIEELGDVLQDHVAKADVQFSAVRSDVKAIHDDLIAHDERANMIAAQINELLDLKRLDVKIETLRQKLRDHLRIEL